MDIVKNFYFDKLFLKKNVKYVPKVGGKVRNLWDFLGISEPYKKP